MTPDPTPSKAARRAAELCLEQSYGVASNGQDFQTLLWGDQVPLFAEIIERETGAGACLRMIERLLTHINEQASADPASIVLESDARNFLQRFNQD